MSTEELIAYVRAHPEGGTIYYGEEMKFTTGYVVSRPNHGLILEDHSMIYEEELLKAVLNYYNRFGCWGWWRDGEHLHFDANDIVPDRERALELARARNQLAIWDVKNQTEVRV